MTKMITQLSTRDIEKNVKAEPKSSEIYTS